MLYRYIHIIHNIHTVKASESHINREFGCNVVLHLEETHLCCSATFKHIMQDEGRRCFTKITHEGLR